MSSYAKLSAVSDELAGLYERKAALTKELAKAYRIQEIWPEAFGKEGKVEMFMTHLGGTGTVPRTTRFWIERMEDHVKKEITSQQWDYIKCST